MQPLLPRLAAIRKQLVTQQSSFNECLSLIDSVIGDQIGAHSTPDGKAAGTGNSILKRFPLDITTKRGKLKFILNQSSKWLTAREIKEELRLFGEELPNVDQSLVNLEKAKQIRSRIENGRKKYMC